MLHVLIEPFFSRQRYSINNFDYFVDGGPECGTDVTTIHIIDANRCDQEPEANIAVHCRVSYWGNVAPDLVWRTSTGEYVNYTAVTSSTVYGALNNITSMLSVPRNAVKDGDVYVCHVLLPESKKSTINETHVRRINNTISCKSKEIPVTLAGKPQQWIIVDESASGYIDFIDN